MWIAHPGGMEFDCIVIAPILLSHCGFFFMSLDVKYLLLVGSHLFYRWFNNFSPQWRFDSAKRYYNNSIKLRAETYAWTFRDSHAIDKL